MFPPVFDASLEKLPPPPAGGFCVLPALSTSAAAALFRAWLRRDEFPCVLVADTARTLEALYQDLHTLGGGRTDDLAYFPGWENVANADLRGVSPEIAGDRLQTLLRLHAGTARAVVTDVQALLQPVPAASQLAAATLRLRRGDRPGLETLCEQLLDLGYSFEPEVLDKGEAAKRGGVLDLWPPNQPAPLRLDFFGDEIDSLRAFDPATQRSLETFDQLEILPVREENANASFCDYLPSNTRWLLFEATSIAEHAELYAANTEGLQHDWPGLQNALRAKAGGGILRTGDGLDGPRLPLEIFPCAGLASAPEEGRGFELVETARKHLIAEQLALANEGWSVVFCLNTAGSQARFREAYAADLGEHPRVFCVEGMIAEGFVFPALRLSVVAERDVYGLRKAARNKYDPHAATRRGFAAAGARITEWTDMQPGEWVVHIDHGIGKYLGLYEIEFAGQKQEVLSLEYAGGAKLHVPVTQAHLLSRYVAFGGGHPEPHTLGGTRWLQQKVVAEKAVRDLAAQLLETQALRASQPGHAFATDGVWQAEFEATFPFAETVDQESAIRAVKQDMEQSKPMDRLICGDVGYGKTEVAMRAAFKAVMDGKQVAVLVPTTILALQHFQSFSERMASFPVRIGMLSRFRTAAEQRETVSQLKRGEIDIVIGTHRLVSRDVSFKDLGLVVIDEEQRFGVAHKERLKQMKGLVDVLTLSATPIPRTLYLSLTGARDVSSIQTAPRERLPVLTEVEPYDLAVIRKAVLRELNRGGQVFFLHNRVQTIELIHRQLAEVLPEARVLVGHGQMPERRLEDIIRRFAEGKADVLLCTTIIESGVDMPNVNTMIIDRADRFGLAELYQLRGRVGRYKHQAHCLLLLPPEAKTRAASRERIRVIQKYSALGSGFKIAMRDLEIRGAGNLLGPQQSGFIASVGFDLYCQLLEQSVRKLKKLPPQRIVDVKIKLDFIDMRPEASDTEAACCLPVTYLEDESLRVEIYRRIGALAGEEAVEALAEEIGDRFGRPPLAVRHLLLLARIRIAASAMEIREVETREGKLLLRKHGEFLLRGKRFPRLYAKTPGDKLAELLHVLHHWNEE